MHSLQNESLPFFQLILELRIESATKRDKDKTIAPILQTIVFFCIKKEVDLKYDYFEQALSHILPDIAKM